MDVSTDYFDRLPDEVIQLIFASISDCKSLVRCMSVSKAFRQQSIRAPSLSIVCPGSFSSYDERLDKIYSMVKGFRNLQSLVVRVGQPKEEPPSWARCMRYAEIGGSVEKFVFMAAKSGDFSELDLTLLGLENEVEEDKDADPPDSIARGTMSATSSGMVDNNEQTQRTHIRHADGSTEAWSNIDSDEELGHRDFLLTDKSGERRIMEGSQNDGESAKSCIYSELMKSSECFLEGTGQRRELSDFNLRQVIAPSAEILQRMLPVIHFAIVQGLNELRDSLPAFVSQFPELRRFLLVDMVESITVYMREHNIQDIRASYVQELSEWDTDVLKKAVSTSSRAEQDNSEGQAVLPWNKVDRDGQRAKGELDTIRAVDSERSCGMAKERSLKAVSSFVSDDCHTQESEGSRHVHDENNGDGNFMVVTSEGDDDCWSLKRALRDRAKKGKELVSACNSRFRRSCQLDISESDWQLNAVSNKGKGKLLPEYHSHFGQTGRSLLSDGPPCTDSAPLHDWRELVGGCHDRKDRALACEDFTEDNLELNSSEDSDGVTDVEDYSMECLDSRHSDVNVRDAGLDACDESNQVRALAQVEGDGADLSTVNTKRGTNQLPRLRHVDGLDGQSGGRDGNSFRDRDDVHMWKSCVSSRDAKLDLTSRHSFKRGQRTENLRMRDSNRVIRLSLDSRLYGEGVHGNRCLKSMSNTENIERNREICKEAETDSQFNLHMTTGKVCCVQGLSTLQAGASCSRFNDRVLLTLSDTTSSESDRDGGKQTLALEQSMTAEPGAALNSRVEARIPDGLPERNHNSPLLCNSGVHHNATTSDTADNIDESSGLGTEVPEDPQLEGKQRTTERPRAGSMPLDSRALLVERPVDTEVWRYAWRERVRRLRDNLRHASSQGEQERNREERRERSREVFRKRQRDLEKDALSFDYTFWRAEKVAACNYTLSDISMCIATNAAKPLRDADKEILKHAALSGPLLVATVLHVNKQHTSHNL